MLTPLIELPLERDRKTWNFGPFNSVHHHRKFEGVNHVEIENLKPIKMDKMYRLRPPVVCGNYNLFKFSRF